MSEMPAQADTPHAPGAPQGVAADETFSDPLLGCLEVVARYYDRGVPRQALISGLPMPEGRLTPRLFPRAAMRAGLSAKVVRRPLAKLHRMLLPAIVLMSDESALILLKKDSNAGEADVLLPETGGGTDRVRLAELEETYSGYAILLKPEFNYGETRTFARPAAGKNWFWEAIKPLWPTYAQVIVAAGLVNILALAAPLFIMNVYDRVLPNEAVSTLWVLALGVGLAIVFDFILKTLRVALIGNAGRRADVMLAGRIFSHVLALDLSSRPHRTGEFANHLKDFEIVREFFTSNTVVTMTDLLFMGLFIFIIYQIAGVAALVPATAAVLVIVIGLAIQRPMRRVVDQSQSEAGYRHSLLLDAISGLETIKTAGAESQVQRQWEQFVGQNADTAHRLRSVSSLGVNLSAFVQQFVTVGVVIVGVYLFQQGEVSSGAIIASVILAGRAVAPLGQLAAAFARAQQAFTSLRTLNQLMQMPEDGTGETRHIDRGIESGRIEFDGVDVTDVPANKRDLAMMFQDIALYPHMTIAENIAYPLKIDGVPKDERRETVREAAELMRIEDMLDKHPGELSGGQQQRAALARTLVQDPIAFLMDEPLSDLDAQLKTEMRKEIQRVHKRLGKPTIYVTHDQSEAFAVADRVAVMNAGRVEQVATPVDLYRHPATPFVARFIGMENLYSGEVVSHGPPQITTQLGLLRLPDGVSLPPEGERVTVLVRPDAARAGGSQETSNVVQGEVAAISFRGRYQQATMHLGDGVSLVLEFDAGRELPPAGEKLRVALAPEALILFPASPEGEGS
jgi:ATP-binding cassette subfamily C protein LapB